MGIKKTLKDLSSISGMSLVIYHSIILAILFGHVRTDTIDAQFSRSYFGEKCIHQLVVFACWDIYERATFIREAMQLDSTISYIPIAEDLELKRILKVNYYKLGLILDLDCPQSETVLNQDRLPYNESYFWLMITQTIELPVNLLETLPLTIETEVTVALRRNDIYILYDVYNPSYRHGGHLNVTYLGRWETGNGLKMELTQYKYKRRGNLAGMPLNFSVLDIKPPVPMDFITYLSNPIERHLDTMHRFNYVMMLQLKDYYNFTINMKKTDTWGYMVNGSFTGMLREMISGLVDVGITPMQFKEERIDVAEFTVQAWIARPCFIFRHPKRHVGNAFLRPFRIEVWWVTVVTAVVYWLFLVMTIKIELHYNKRAPVSTLDSYPSSESALITFASISQQGLSDGPRLYSGRIVFISLFLWGLLSYQFYSASVVGSLLAEAPRYINTLKDLSDSNMPVGIEDIAYNYDFFATTSDPVALELYWKKIAPGRKRSKAPYYSPEEGLRRVKMGNFAFHVDVATAYKIIEDTFTEDEICDLVEIQLFPAKHTATVTKKHSPFKKMVTYGLRQIVEHGMVHRLRKVWHHQRPQCPKSHSSIPVPVTLEEFRPAILLLVMGLGVAVFVIVVERLTERNKTRLPNRIPLAQGW